MKKLFLVLITMVLGASVYAQNQITLEDFTVKRSFAASRIGGLRPSANGERYMALSPTRRQIIEYSYKSGLPVDTIINLDELKSDISEIENYSINSTGTWMLIQTKTIPIYRRSFTAEYYIYEFRNRDIMPLSENGAQSAATFSPTGEKIAFARNNNLYIHDLRFHSEIQITKDGKRNEIINGIPDWVYEEEFSCNKAFEWAPDGSALAYVKFNEKDVKEFDMAMYGALYPRNYTYKYPVPGEANSKVSVHVYDCFDRTTFKMEIGEDTNVYVPRIRWTRDPKRLAIFKLNRRQNKLELLSANVRTGESSVMYREENRYYINNDNFDAYTFTPDGQSLIVINESNGYRQLQQYSLTGKLQKSITPAKYDVIDFYGFDPVKGMYYYSSYEEGALEKHVYCVDSRGVKRKLTPKDGWNEVSFSSNFAYYIVNNSSNERLPNTTLYSTAKGRQLRVLVDNRALEEKIATYVMPKKEFTTFKAADGVTELNGWVMKPTHFDEGKKYPVLITQYSGPYSQSVQNMWSVDWLNYVAEQGVVVVCVDPRGTGGRGEAFGKCTYMQLGKYESDDVIATAKQLSAMSWVNGDKIGIWGWSYGGFMASLCTLKGNDLFSMGIAVAPVTNFRFYDSIYTERYMREPGENGDGYDLNSPINYVDNFKRGSLLLIHGTADDNVHVGNTYELAEALTQADKQFDMVIYKDRNHSIFGGNTTKQLYQRFVNYIKANLLH
ncbi:MAG: S9 family peptidase [Marinifilaceae bacterium]|nr:S9 family peptidase [Marinifilaceae bacterium]